MKTPLFSAPGPEALVKEGLAAKIRAEIVSGQITPGEAIVEGDWAARFGVSQSSVREALHILAAEGFVQKDAGRSARVTKLSAEDVSEIYELRARLEGMAAGLLSRGRQPLDEADEIVALMHEAAEAGDMTGLIGNDLRFHMLLCEKCGNRFLFEHACRLLVPLFAFVQMRVHTTKQGPEPWKALIPIHHQILEIVRVGDPFVAEQFVVRTTLHRFGKFAYDIWENRPMAAQPSARNA